MAANGVTTSTPSYDALNRPAQTTYTNTTNGVSTPSVSYIYDGDFRGALSSVAADGFTSTSYTHDPLGRIATSIQNTNAIPYQFSYQYSLTDQLTSITYPSGRQITYALDGADRVTTVTGSLSGVQTPYAQNITYTAAGGITGLTSGNGLSSALTWNDRLQPTALSVKTSTSNQVLGLNFYPCPSSATACSTQNNGNLYSQTMTDSSGAAPTLALTQTYSYSNLNQLTAVAEGSSLEQYGYDIYGNRWVTYHSSALTPLTVETPTASTAYSSSVPNQINGWSYDANGNVKSRMAANGVTTSTPSYDALNRPAQTTYTNTTNGVSTPSVSYIYDGDFRGALSSVAADGFTSTSYTHDPLGRIATSIQNTSAIPYLFSYQYSLTDQLTSITYPSGRQITYALDGADRATTVTGTFSGVQTPYAQNITYTAASGITGLTSGNGLSSTLTWNDRLQPTALSVKTSTSNQVLGLNFYPCPSSATACSTQNNGNLYSQTMTDSSGAAPTLALTQTYSYSNLNQLTAVAEGSSLEQYGYDIYGNRWVTYHSSALTPLTVETPTASTAYSSSVPNQINGWSYDGAGNILSVNVGVGGTRSFTYL